MGSLGKEQRIKFQTKFLNERMHVCICFYLHLNIKEQGALVLIVSLLYPLTHRKMLIIYYNSKSVKLLRFIVYSLM